MSQWLWASWSTVGWVIVTTSAIYATTVVVVRIGGRRTLAELSAFDVVVTVAVGSLVATTAVSPSASYLQGATAITTLLALQTLVATVRTRVPALRRLLDFRPELIARDGQMNLSKSPLSAQVTEEELRSKLRRRGVFDLDDVRVVILEPTGEVSWSGEADPDALSDLIVRRP